ncbi:MAG: hypothetical protein Q9160_008684 [Pyrenula sp. 1 TL-2023]
MEATLDDSTLSQDWTQFLHWDGNQDSNAQNDPIIGLGRLNIPTDQLAISHHSYPASPTLTNQESAISAKTQHAQSLGFELPTPSHSSASPESAHLRNPSINGESFWDTRVAEISPPSLKRKFPTDPDAQPPAKEALNEKRPTKKRPHNIIEKRYRANLNEKIAELRDSVPSLRVAKKSEQDGDDEGDDEELQGLAPSNKLNKASILTKAVEYIRHLEMRTKRLDDENILLKQRLLKLEKMMAQGTTNSAQRAAAFTSEHAVEVTDPSSEQTEGTKSSESSKNPIQGLIPVPEAMRKLRENLPQEHYGHVYDSESRGGRKWPTRFMLGSLAGLMIMEGFSEGDGGSESKNKGLFGIPLELLDGVGFFRAPRVYLAAFYNFCQAGGVFPLVKGFIALSAVAFIIFAYLFNSKPNPAKAGKEQEKPRAAPSLASPIEVRRQAWLTSAQVLKIPHQSFFSEWAALTTEWIKYMVRLVLGLKLYLSLTGQSAESEQARVKAWDIAIDAQLAGGDPEIRRSRVVLTVFASGLLPRTPARMMVKALHCRVLLWRVGRENSRFARFWNRVGLVAAANEWRMAQEIQDKLPVNHPDRLPNHLAFILQQPCHEVMLDDIVQRAYNLMFGRPTAERTPPETSSLDVIVDDQAICSPLDALAAWWSSNSLRHALSASPSISDEPRKEFYSHLEAAAKSAPPLSCAHTRAVAAKAVFLPVARTSNVETVRAALPPSSPSSNDKANSSDSSQTSLPTFIDSSCPLAARTEISTVATCAEILSLLENETTLSVPVLRRATTLFAQIPIEPTSMTLLSFTSAAAVLKRFSDISVDTDAEIYGGTVRCLCAWTHGTHREGLFNGDGQCAIVNLIERTCEAVSVDEPCPCLAGRRNMSRLSFESGYGTAVEDDEEDLCCEKGEYGFV